MKKYDEYKDSGVSWIGEIPKVWGISKIKYSTYVKGRIGWQGLKSDEFIDEGPYLVTGTDLVNGNIVWETCYHISEERYTEAPQIQLENGDLLITKDGTIGKISIVTDKPDKAILNSGLFVTRPLGNIYITKFMYWVLNSKVFWSYYGYLETGSTIKHLYQETFENFSFPLPDLATQKSISNYLDRKTAAIDSLIEDKQKLIELLKEKRQAIISEAVTKGLDKNAKMKDSGIEWIGDIPENWEVKRLKQVSKLKTGTTPAGNEGINYDNNGLCWFTPADFNPNMKLICSEKFIDENTIKSKNITVYPKNSVLLVAIGATVGKIGYTIDDSYSNQQITAIIPNDVLGKYLLYYIASKANYIKENALYTTLPIINNAYLGSIYVVIPAMEEQIQIVNYIDQQTEEIDSLTADITEQIEKLKEYHQAIISEAVTGKVVI